MQESIWRTTRGQVSNNRLKLPARLGTALAAAIAPHWSISIRRHPGSSAYARSGQGRAKPARSLTEALDRLTMMDDKTIHAVQVICLLLFAVGAVVLGLYEIVRVAISLHAGESTTDQPRRSPLEQIRKQLKGLTGKGIVALLLLFGFVMALEALKRFS